MISVEDVGHQGQYPVAVKEADSCGPEMGISHSQSGRVPVVEQEARTENDDGSPDTGNANI